MLSGVARTPGQCIADEKELHVIEGKGWQPRMGIQFCQVLVKIGTCGPRGLDAIGCKRLGPFAGLHGRQDSRQE